jgi:hypothetical protein
MSAAGAAGYEPPAAALGPMAQHAQGAGQAAPAAHALVSSASAQLRLCKATEGRITLACASGEELQASGRGERAPCTCMGAWAK